MPAETVPPPDRFGLERKPRSFLQCRERLPPSAAHGRRMVRPRWEGAVECRHRPDSRTRVANKSCHPFWVRFGYARAGHRMLLMDTHEISQLRKRPRKLHYARASVKGRLRLNLKRRRSHAENQLGGREIRRRMNLRGVCTIENRPREVPLTSDDRRRSGRGAFVNAHLNLLTCPFVWGWYVTVK